MSKFQFTAVIRKCKACGREFRVSAGRVRDGRGYFCSLRCKRNYRMPIKERFLKYVGETDERGCILWTGAKNNGYGQLHVGTHLKRKMIPASRIAYELAYGPIPPGLCALHTCDNPTCVNPEHLFLGTGNDNMKDKIAKGRQTKGEAINTSKLLPGQVLEIRRRYALGESQVALGREFKVRQCSISDIVNGKSWKHLLPTTD